MNKAYSNKALPPGTVLREWRLEEVLGVGGFGIVYKARGIYFNELVAIKEYFPSSISERDSDDTVVPIDSDAEEVHALGLKKFVEEAKLLWNLSTPTRHPNIVSVRSLFEIHGTAYIVMDFEDGISLSKMLKQGRRFNERSLWNILHPIAEGLERAHRVGVLHRDIKPPNILINEDNLPVLIDFGSARFAAAEATSTTVTFHTPPYAAIEQYVKTYTQGPWTDVYALGVVMYECVTGEKPAEVLERLHAGLGKPLSEGKWPGYGKRFLAAVDAAMTVKPEDRPQSIGEWLAMFGKDVGQSTDAVDDEATRFYAKQVETEEIVPVPATPNVDPKAPVETGVPDDPKQAKFKRAGEETLESKKQKSEAAAAAAAQDAPDKKKGKADEAAAASPPPAKAGAKTAEAAAARKSPSPAVLAGAAAALLLVVGGGALALRGGRSQPEANQAIPAVVDNSAPTSAALGPAETANETANTTANAPAAEPAQPTAEQSNAAAALAAEKAKSAAAEAQIAAMKKAQAKAAAAPALPGAPTALGAQKTKKAAAVPGATASTAQTGSVSPAKMAQFNATVDEARALAAQAMRSNSGQNSAMARNYDKYLKTLKDSGRGIQSDKEADKLIKQANQTKAYIQFLLRQP
jgi:non-specific serine/threonine protein kinase